MFLAVIVAQKVSWFAVLMDTDLLARSGGLRVLLHVMGEGPHELAPIIASAFLHIVDSPRTRVYLSIGTDIEVT
jgi:large subunit ribosomal protein L17e